MSPDEIKAKAATLAELFAAVAVGKTLQLFTDAFRRWENAEYFPTMDSDLSRWRVKPEPRRMWEVTNPKEKSTAFTLHDEDVANKWKAEGYTVTEWQEVLPE